MARNSLRNQSAPESAPRPLILVVEADRDTQALYRMLFPSERYTVEICDDGAEALGRAICQPPDLIVTEAHVPRIDGFALSHLLRSDAATRHVPIVMVTSMTSKADRTRARRAGADAVISKPFDVDDLDTAVRQILGAPRSDVAAWPQEPVGNLSNANETGGNTPRRLSLSRRLQRRRTTNPPLTPPLLRCPSCDAKLVYEQSYVGGVSEREVEQWDYFACARCGPFQYRHRTRKLKQAV